MADRDVMFPWIKSGMHFMLYKQGNEALAKSCEENIRKVGKMMLNVRRVITATFFGVVMGLICFLGGKYGLKDDITTTEFLYIMVNRILIGFVIGISVLRLHWAWHGIAIGVIVGLPFAMGCLLEPDNFETAIAALILGAVYGFLIELFTSVILHAHADPHPVAAD